MANEKVFNKVHIFGFFRKKKEKVCRLLQGKSKLQQRFYAVLNIIGCPCKESSVINHWLIFNFMPLLKFKIFFVINRIINLCNFLMIFLNFPLYFMMEAETSGSGFET